MYTYICTWLNWSQILRGYVAAIVLEFIRYDITGKPQKKTQLALVRKMAGHNGRIFSATKRVTVAQEEFMKRLGVYSASRSMDK